MTRERKVLLGLTANAVLLLSLVACLTLSLNWSLLGTCTLLFILLYPVIWLCWKGWNFWCQPIMQLTTYAQILKEGQHNLHYTLGDEADLFTGLLLQIDALATSKQRDDELSVNIERLVSQMMDAWNQPICLFDPEQRLLYSNPAANKQIKQPMLRGKRAEALGFSWLDGAFTHGAFDSGWQCQSIQYRQSGANYGLFSAFYIAASISEAEIASQKNLVRVLSHELRNSLTPMASMADTLLSAPQFTPEQVRMVLGRIQQRSERLLKFIQQYAQLSHLPKPQPSWFEFRPMLDEAVAMLPHKNEVNFHGESRCFADPELLSQLLINLLKNAVEACPQERAVIDVILYHSNQMQYLRISDNGEGFANLENVLVPFYTTKAGGSGIGLALCAEIARHHGGELKPSNSERGGASVEISWPLMNA